MHQEWERQGRTEPAGTAMSERPETPAKKQDLCTTLCRQSLCPLCLGDYLNPPQPPGAGGNASRRAGPRQKAVFSLGATGSLKPLRTCLESISRSSWEPTPQCLSAGRWISPGGCAQVQRTSMKCSKCTSTKVSGEGSTA